MAPPSITEAPSAIIQKFSLRRREAHKNTCREVILYSTFGKLCINDTITEKEEGSVHDSKTASIFGNTTQEVLYDPAKWKDQDHYAILGLEDKRFLSTEHEIKHAYRKMILSHHPDKLQQSQVHSQPTGKKSVDARFQCIQKAFEILSDPDKRRQYDSVDPNFDESSPDSVTQAQAAKDPAAFYKIYGAAFQRNARFSTKMPVPCFGDANTTRESLEYFYEFWYSFESRRTFEYLDEEDPAIADNRYDRRYIERKNKANQQKKKSQDNARILKLVDQAKAADPRMAYFQALEKQERELWKEQKRIEREEAKKKEQEERARQQALFELQKQKNAPEPPVAEPILTNTQQYNDSAPWSPYDIQCLLAAVKKIPGGVINRWQVIRDYLQQHTGNVRSTEAIISKAKEIQGKEQAALDERQGWDNLQKECIKKKVDPRVNQPLAPSFHPERPIVSSDTTQTVHWSVQDQKALEDALKQVPVTFPNRWDEIASRMQSFGKTKKDCMLRCKELALKLAASKATTQSSS
jgi:DnaJ family protein C protein 2